MATGHEKARKISDDYFAGGEVYKNEAVEAIRELLAENTKLRDGLKSIISGEWTDYGVQARTIAEKALEI